MVTRRKAIQTAAATIGASTLPVSALKADEVEDTPAPLNDQIRELQKDLTDLRNRSDAIKKTAAESAKVGDEVIIDSFRWEESDGVCNLRHYKGPATLVCLPVKGQFQRFKVTLSCGTYYDPTEIYLTKNQYFQVRYIEVKTAILELQLEALTAQALVSSKDPLMEDLIKEAAEHGVQLNIS